MKRILEAEAGALQSAAPLTNDEKTLILANLRLSVADRLKRHDAALQTLNQLRTAVRAARPTER